MDVTFGANSTTQTLTFNVTLKKEDVLELLKANAIINQPGWEIKSAKYLIPSGGDYSGMALDVDQMPIVVSLERKTDE